MLKLKVTEMDPFQLKVSLLVVIVTNLTCIVYCQNIIQESYVPYIGKYQTEENLHAVAPLLTNHIDTECANYCSLRGSQFR